MGREMGSDWHAAYASAIEWWRDAGVDTLVEDAPRDWLARPAPAPAESGAAVGAAPSAPEALPATLDAFLAWRLGEAAPEAEWLTPRIAPTGPSGGAMILVDMPEADDAETGILMSGAPGRLLDRMLAAIGESRETVLVGSIAVARSLTGRIPADQEARLAELARHYVSLVAPKRLLLMGDTAKRVFGTTDGSGPGNSLGDINQSGGSLQPVASYSPRFLLERPATKAEAWKHLLLFSRGISQ